MLATLLLLPVFAAAIALARVPDRARLQLFRAVAFAHLALAIALWSRPAEHLFGGYIALDAVGLLVLTPMSALFAGIALALLGTVLLAIAATDASGDTTLFIRDLTAGTVHLAKPWLHAAFVLLLMGYGTKMGLAPMHAWKPDAYGEAPPPVAGLLAGTATNCAVLG